MDRVNNPGGAVVSFSYTKPVSSWCSWGKLYCPDREDPEEAVRSYLSREFDNPSFSIISVEECTIVTEAARNLELRIGYLWDKDKLGTPDFRVSPKSFKVISLGKNCGMYKLWNKRLGDYVGLFFPQYGMVFPVNRGDIELRVTFSVDDIDPKDNSAIRERAKEIALKCLGDYQRMFLTKVCDVKDSINQSIRLGD